jgi:hypothetical protein
MVTASIPQPSGISPGADADARFAAWLDDIAAGTDDPRDGEVCKQILNDDPHGQRVLFDFVEALIEARPVPDMWPPLAAAVLLVVAAIAAVVVIAVA